nr:glycosyltransferase [Saprospiraceae bacterium]
ADATYRQRRLRCLFNRGPLFYLEMQFRLFFYLLFSSRSSVYGAVDLDTLPANWMVSRLRRAELLFDAHEIFDRVPELEGKPFVRWVWRTTGKFFVPAAKYRWTVNQSLADRFKAEYSSDFEVIRNLPEPGMNGVNTRRKHRLILYQGRVNKGRGLEEAIETMRFLPEFQLVIAGGGDIEAHLRYRVYQLKLNNVTITGDQSPEQLRNWTAQAWIGLNLLDEESGNYYFSLANKFFDYMAFGVPSISMDFPEYRLLNDRYHFSLLIPKLNPLIICRAIEKLDKDPNLHSTLSENALKAYAVLNWQNESEKVVRSLLT